MAELAPSPLDPRARAVVDRLHARSDEQLSTMSDLDARLRKQIRDSTLSATEPTEPTEAQEWLADKLVALDPSKAALCHVLCRSLGARRVVEAGTSYGVSTIYLAAAVRDTIAENGGDGVVIGTEHEPDKVAMAHQHLEEAGLADYAEVREGDLRQTLQDLDGPIDFMLVDIWIPMALPALKLVTPHLRPGALVVCDNVLSGGAAYAGYLDYVRDPSGRFTSVTIPGDGGLEISMKR